MPSTRQGVAHWVFIFTLYDLRMRLRLGQGLRLQLSDIDAKRQRAHIRTAKGNKDCSIINATLVCCGAFGEHIAIPFYYFPIVTAV